MNTTRRADEIRVGDWVITASAAGGEDHWRVEEIETERSGEIILIDDQGTTYSNKAGDLIETVQ